jgi:hypothetical protein
MDVASQDGAMDPIAFVIAQHASRRVLDGATTTPRRRRGDIRAGRVRT